MKTLQEHYNAIKTGQGNKAQFVKQAKNLFPEYFNQYSNYDNTVSVLKSKQIISETAGGVVSKGFDIFNWKKILAEETKAVEKETSKEVLDDQKNNYNNKDMKNADNINFNEIMKGFYCEMKDPANKNKTGDELKAMVVKNLAKDCLYYTKDGMFGVKGVGYTTEAPGLGTPKEPKGKHKSSGYGELKENTNEALYQGPSVKVDTSGGLGGKRFIPTVTVLSRDAVDAINAKGARRLNWEKPHIKIVKSGDGIKLLISKLLLDTIVGSQRGRSKLSLAVSKMGTGITPEEMSELSGEFKKLVKVLNSSGKLSQNGDYFLLDVPTKYNEKYNNFEMPLPATIAESGISEGIEEYDNMSDQEIIQWAYDDGFEDFIVYDGEDGLANREEVLRALLGAEDLGSEESEEEMWDPDDIDPAGGYGPSSHMESIAEQKLRSLIRNIIKEEMDPNKFELGQENPEDAPMGTNDKSASKPMKAKVDIKSTLEKIATAVFTEKDLNKAKEIFRSHIENSGINDKDKKTILRNIDATKTKPRLDSYLVNSLLHYEGMGTSQIKEDTTKQKLLSLIHNIIKEEISK